MQCDADKDVKEQAVGKWAALKAAIGREELPEEFLLKISFMSKRLLVGVGENGVFRLLHWYCKHLLNT